MEVKGLKKKAWALRSEYVRRLADGQCFTCLDKRPWKEQQAGHFVHRDSMDHSEQGIQCQCVRCNRWKHGNLGVYAVKLDKKFGSGTAERLELEGKKVRQFKRLELEAIIFELELKIEDLKKDP